MGKGIAHCVKLARLIQRGCGCLKRGPPCPASCLLAQQQTVSKWQRKKKMTKTKEVKKMRKKKREEEESIEGEEKSPPNSPLLIDLTEDEEDITLVLSEPPELIDLTDDRLTPPPPQEPLSKRETHSLPTSTGKGGHHAPNVVHGVRLSSPVVLELSDSQTSGNTSSGCSVRSKRSVSVESTHRALGSPNCLPPTPGRENVHAILQRPDFP
ncbi:hypothetical protein GBAR_LOCUS23069 [Geodia barretti]|uniref:Uncharacterized protein n=1 Tax=Geodia barretti TaxID=519541 RepID=A0AA35T5S9_GEOBA|nr:hypothetical protein GBAR_LOCUS23069 [Geodia barretti]